MREKLKSSKEITWVILTRFTALFQGMVNAPFPVITSCVHRQMCPFMSPYIYDLDMQHERHSIMLHSAIFMHMKEDYE